MSIKTLQENSSYSKRFLKNLPATSFKNHWVRNPNWLTLPNMTSSDSKFIGLVAVYPDAAGGEPSNFVALKAAGNYTVNWGDGVTENFNSNVTAYHIYDYNDADLVNTNAPVTLTDSGDKVERTAHGYSNGMPIEFYNIVSTTGINEGQTYYVINANPNDFQISSTINGSPVTLTTNGSANLLRYKQAIITITPQAGQNLTSVNISRKHNQSGLQDYRSNFLDVKVGSPNLTSLFFFDYFDVSHYHNNLEQIEITNIGSISDFTSLFANLIGLRNVTINANTSAVTSLSGMFENCSSLVSFSYFDTSNVTDMSYMFSGCYSLVAVPLFNTAKVTTMTNMFWYCHSLSSVPLFDTANVTDMSVMFSDCYSLSSVPLFNTAKVTNMSYMFYNCHSLSSVPLFNTANVTNMNSMFYNCYSLLSVPLFNTANVTNMSYMFNYCPFLSVPLFNTANATNMAFMFNNCQKLQNCPNFNTTNVTSVASMFLACYSLNHIGSLNLGNLSSSHSYTISCPSLANIDAYGCRRTHSIESCKLSKTALKKYMDNLGTIATAGQTLTITNNWGIGFEYSKIVTSTAQSTTVSCSDTSNLAVGMMMSGTGTGITTGVSVASDVSADTLTLNNHGLPNGTKVSFSALGTTTGVSTNTIYYVINSTTNTFQISLTAGGSAIDLTGSNTTMTLKYGNYISSINPNVSITLDTPAASSQINAFWTFRFVDAYGALLRGWSVTF